MFYLFWKQHKSVPQPSHRTINFQESTGSKTYETFHKINCSSACVIYLMECTLCTKKYVAKEKTAFHIRINNQINGVKNLYTKTILACKHFQEKIIPSVNMQNSLLWANFPTEKKKEILPQHLTQRGISRFKDQTPYTQKA